jgi:hypothetical protein
MDPMYAPSDLESSSCPLGVSESCDPEPLVIAPQCLEFVDLVSPKNASNGARITHL